MLPETIAVGVLVEQTTYRGRGILLASAIEFAHLNWPTSLI